MERAQVALSPRALGAPEGAAVPLSRVRSVPIQAEAPLELAALLSHSLGSHPDGSRLPRVETAPSPGVSRTGTVSAQYLVDPAAFPARDEGLPWGRDQARFAIAGVSVAIQGLSALQRETVESLYPVSGLYPPAAQVSLFQVDPGAFRRIDPRGWNYSLDFSYGPSHTHLVGKDWMARLEWERDPMSAGLWIIDGRPGALSRRFRELPAGAHGPRPSPRRGRSPSQRGRRLVRRSAPLRGALRRREVDDLPTPRGPGGARW